MKNILLLLVLSLFLISCEKEKKSGIGTVEAYKPIYLQKEQAFSITSSEPQILLKPGKLYLYLDYIYITDKGSGVHIIDNRIPTDPKKLAFIAIPGVNDIAVKNGYLLADNITDLVSIDIRVLSDIKISKRIKNVYPTTNQLYPEFATGYFECVDTTKGYVIGWELTDVTDPKCFR